MAELHQHPDGWVYVRTPGETYMDCPENFAADFGVALPPLPEGANERIYTQGRRHALMGDGNVVAGGEMPWLLGDQVIDRLEEGLQAQQTRHGGATANAQATLN